jgi:hypothetical protein
MQRYVAVQDTYICEGHRQEMLYLTVHRASARMRLPHSSSSGAHARHACRQAHPHLAITGYTHRPTRASCICLYTYLPHRRCQP